MRKSRKLIREEKEVLIKFVINNKKSKLLKYLN